uniref:Response regulator receiver protein n=1 Tax=Solibacter usitatus (strain Ellin6076) TaxID=234267 RepID=Q01W85_SOLUE
MVASRILIVDDDTQVRSFLTLAFENAGYEVKTAGCGSDAIALLSQESFDLMLSDIMMPGMNGHQLARWVIHHFPATRTALMSGFDAVCESCDYAPACKLIAKPFTSSEVVSFVRQMLQS